MRIKRFRGLLVSAVALVMVSLTGAGSAVAQNAGTATALGEKCSTVRTTSSKGYVSLCWNWTADGQGTYLGAYYGTFYDTAPTDGQWVVLQATWNGAGGWVSVASAADGGSFHETYTELAGLTFRACTSAGYCGSAAA
ncbi:hypothetical protein [Streptomyces sp. SID3212]|uniref:hypothetical protein n=1 Tax=Streptomyces sp. SID3212 TaxID=2690259 RepID=UPI00136D1D58|nr:hypothetical protein [Streptomyces sp. SID3212]MYV57665.1 hypothetical protein [Streptomyces sp. SID3212]